MYLNFSTLASNAEGQFFLSTDNSPGGLRKIAETIGRQISDKDEFDK